VTCLYCAVWWRKLLCFGDWSSDSAIVFFAKSVSLEMGRVRESIWRRRGERGQRYRNKGPTVVSAIAEGCDRVLLLNNSWPTEDAAYRGYRRATGRLGCTFCFAPSSHASRRGISFRTDDNVNLFTHVSP